MEHINIEIKGKFNQYAVLTAEQGYCFYEINEEQRSYLTQIFTPIVDELELEKTYVAVQGNAEELNKERERQFTDTNIENIEGEK